MVVKLVSVINLDVNDVTSITTNYVNSKKKKKKCIVPNIINLSLSLSLSHTHTHTHTKRFVTLFIKRLTVRF